MDINILKLLTNLSRSLDGSGGLFAHHQHVAFMSLMLGKAAGLEDQALLELFKAAIVHDIGAISSQEKEHLLQFDFENTTDHCRKGYFLLKDSYLDWTANIVRTHHDRWNGGNQSGLCKEAIPLASRIIHLTDRVDILISGNRSILEQRDEIMTRIREFSGIYFDPELVSLLHTLAGNESFWLTMITPWVLEERIADLIPSQKLAIQMADIYNIAGIFARVIDSRSPFTYRHTTGVAATARVLATKLRLPKDECDLAEIAALLHDVGKLSVPENILQKPGPLTASEYNTIKQHTFYTYSWLKPAMPSMLVAEWAAYHHERLDGKGYPFHKTANELDVEARIMAVADIFTALREDRPYRQSLTWPETAKILGKNVKEGAIDGDIVDILLSSRNELDNVCIGPTLELTDLKDIAETT